VLLTHHNNSPSQTIPFLFTVKFRSYFLLSVLTLTAAEGPPHLTLPPVHALAAICVAERQHHLVFSAAPEAYSRLLKNWLTNLFSPHPAREIDQWECIGRPMIVSVSTAAWICVRVLIWRLATPLVAGESRIASTCRVRSRSQFGKLRLTCYPPEAIELVRFQRQAMHLR
jgi:hypothetical protein